MDFDATCRVARSAEGARAVEAYGRLVVAQPAEPVWRLRVAAALEAAGRGGEAQDQRASLEAAARASGHPLVALAAALDRGHEPLSETLTDYLAGAPRLGPPRPPPPPRVPAEPALPDHAPDELPPWPAPPLTGDLPPLRLLSLLDAPALDALAPALGRRSLGAGEGLLREGAVADALYLLVGGTLEVVKEDAARGEVVLARVCPGALVGEMGLVLHRPRSATVRAVTDVEVVVVDLGALRAVADGTPGVARILADFTWRRLSAMWLDTSPGLRDLREPSRRAVLSRVARQEAMEGEILLEEGAAVPALWLLVEGRVRVSRVGGEDREAVVAELGAGQVFGEMGLLSGAPASATVEAVSDCILARLSAEDFAAICARDGALGAALDELGQGRRAENRFIFEDDEFFEEPD